MRLGIVRGTVVLNLVVPQLAGTRLILVEPITSEALAKADGSGGGKILVVADHLGPAEGQMIAFVESREAANPFPGGAPVDAYCSLIVDTVDYRSPQAGGAKAGDRRDGPGSAGVPPAGPLDIHDARQQTPVGSTAKAERGSQQVPRHRRQDPPAGRQRSQACDLRILQGRVRARI